MAICFGNGILYSHLASRYVYVLSSTCSYVERKLALSAFPSSPSREGCCCCYKELTTKYAVLARAARVESKHPAGSLSSAPRQPLT